MSICQTRIHLKWRGSRLWSTVSCELVQVTRRTGGRSVRTHFLQVTKPDGAVLELSNDTVHHTVQSWTTGYISYRTLHMGSRWIIFHSASCPFPSSPGTWGRARGSFQIPAKAAGREGGGRAWYKRERWLPDLHHSESNLARCSPSLRACSNLVRLFNVVKRSMNLILSLARHWDMTRHIGNKLYLWATRLHSSAYFLVLASSLSG